MRDACDTDEERLRFALGKWLSPARISHSESVAALAEELCRRFGLPVRSGRLAGLGHDIARELDEERLRVLSARDGLPFDADEEVLPVLLHGRAGAVMLEEEAGLRDRGLLQAVRDHVTGRPGMGGLSCVLYAADYLEPGRGFLSERERLRALGGELEDMVRVVLRETIRFLERRGRRVARASRELESGLIGEGESDGR